MKKLLYTLAVMFSLPLVSFGQSNYKPGYIVNLKGDTLKGTIDYKEWEKNPGQISFKSNAGMIQVYTPQNAKAFAINGLEYYEKYIVKASQDPLEVNKLGGTPDTTSRIDTVFLRIMTKGRYLSLYSYRDDIKTRYYILEPGKSMPEELAYHAYIDASGSSSVKYINRYRVQLQYVAQKNNVNDSKLAGLLSQSEYSDQSLLKIAAAINGSDPAQVTSKSQFGTRLFAGGSIVNNTMQFNGVYATPKNSDATLIASAGIDLLTNKNIQKLIFRVELSATADFHKFTDVDVQGSSATTTINFNQISGSIAPQIVYNFYNTESLKIFVSAGISINVSAYPNSYLSQELLNGPIKSSTLITYHTVWESYPVKAGIVLNRKLEIFACYIPSAQVTDNYYNFSANISAYRAGINFLFGTK